MTRRRFLAGIGIMGLAAACGSDDPVGSGAPSTTTSTTLAPGTSRLALGVFFPPQGLLHTGGEQRMPLSLFVDGFPADFDEAPDSIEMTVTREPGTPGTTVVVKRHGDGNPRPYYPLRHTFDDTGAWWITADVDGQALEAAVGVADPADIPLAGPGDALGSFQTPTDDDPAGVDPVCTRDPACGLHVTSLADVVGTVPVALLVSSPAFCQTAVCGPVLELVLEQTAVRDDITFIHAEVFADPTADPPVPAPVMSELGLVYEPSLFVADASGTLVSRLDATFDRSEIRAALELLPA